MEIALLKAATFPRLKAVEEVLAGGGTVRATSTAPAPPAKAARETSAARTAAAAPLPDDLVTRVRQKRPLIGGYLEAATVQKNGNRITLLFQDAFAAETVGDAKSAIEEIATEMYGEKTTVETKVQSAEQPGGRRAEDKPSVLRDDPVVRAFQKHLGGELVKESKR